MYKRPEKPAALAQTTPQQNQFQPKTLSKQLLALWQSALNLASLLLKSHDTRTLKEAFGKIKRLHQLKKKYGSFLGNKLHLLQRRKNREHIKFAFSCLQNNRISYYVSQRELQQKTKQNLRQRSAGLISAIYNKLAFSKRKHYLLDLKQRTTLVAKLRSFKSYHLFNLLSSLFTQKQRLAFVRIQAFSKYRISSMRRLGRLQKLIASKRTQNLMNAFIRLRINLIQFKTTAIMEKEQQAKKEAQEDNTAVVETKGQAQRNDRELQAQIRRLQAQQRNLNDKKKSLQSELAKMESQNQRSLQQLQKEVQRLEIENSELVFNHDLLDQNNQELERELQAKQRGGRKKLTKAEIWENVYNNLLHFLSQNKDSHISKQQLLECLEMPLVPCNFNLQDLQEENQILTELLQEYQNNFPEPAGGSSPGGELLPFDVIRKQNRYYYMVLEVLSEWGLPGSKELEQLNSDLAHIQSKLGSS